MDMNIISVVAFMCFSSTSLMGGSAFPLMKSTSTLSRNACKPQCGSRRNGRNTLQVSVSEDKSDTSSDNDSGDEQSYQNNEEYNKRPENILSEFDETIEWEPMDFDEMDDFFATMDYPGDEYVDVDEEMLQEFDKETLLEILGLEDDGETITIPDDDNEEEDQSKSQDFAEWDRLISDQVTTQTKSAGIDKGIEDLERALMGGVVPAEAGVGSGMLPCDYGYDPLELSTKDYFKQIQNFILKLVPERNNIMDDDRPEQEPEAGAAMPTVGFVGEEDRPPALILRDYREAEIRHGRLAMLAAVIWPMQEIFDRLFIPESFGSMTMIYGGPTLPFLPLMMTFFMLNLGYLDIYSSEIKENESGDAFLPGECFWDPLCIMEGTSDTMKRNMQEREILNGRAAMIAVASYIFEEGMTHKPIVSLPTNALLFEPLYQVPFIQQWLDIQFGNIDYTTTSIIDPYL